MKTMMVFTKAPFFPPASHAGLSLDVPHRCSGQRQQPGSGSTAAVTITHFLSTSECASLLEKHSVSQVSPGTLKWRTEIISSIIQAKSPLSAGISLICFGLIYADVCLHILSCSAHEEGHRQVHQTSLFVFSCLCSNLILTV